jgi:hypothetical protein
MAEIALNAHSQHFARLYLLAGTEVKKNATQEKGSIEEVTNMFPAATWEECRKLSEYRVRFKSGTTVTVHGDALSFI